MSVKTCPHVLLCVHGAVCLIVVFGSTKSDQQASGNKGDVECLDGCFQPFVIVQIVRISEVSAAEVVCRLFKI